MTLGDFRYIEAKDAAPYTTLKQADICIDAISRRTTNDDALSCILFYKDMRETLSKSDLLSLANDIARVA